MQKGKEILICSEGLTLTGVLNSSPTSDKLWEKLPIKSVVHRWGNEIYFEVPVKTQLEENATNVVPPGTICFWVEGNSVAIPFGRTPVSIGDECRLVTDVNIIGNIKDSLELLFLVRENTEIEIRKFE